MITDFKSKLQSINPEFVQFDTLKILQVNMGNLCNQRCIHCHVQASPKGTKIMSRDVMNKIVNFLRKRHGLTLDITGGCPEMNPHFRFFLESTHPFVSRLMVRTNLTILMEKGMEWISGWYKTQAVNRVLTRKRR